MYTVLSDNNQALYHTDKEPTSQADREDAEFEALTSERVRRTAPLITMLQGELSLTDVQVDALFESPDT